MAEAGSGPVGNLVMGLGHAGAEVRVVRDPPYCGNASIATRRFTDGSLTDWALCGHHL